MSTTNEDWELKEGKLHFHGNFVKNKNFKEFNFIKKDFKSTISKKEEAQFLHQRFKILAHVLKENLSPNFYESEVDHTTKNLSTILEPALLIFIGLVVGFVAMSIINPIYQLTSRVGS